MHATIWSWLQQNGKAYEYVPTSSCRQPTVAPASKAWAASLGEYEVMVLIKTPAAPVQTDSTTKICERLCNGAASSFPMVTISVDNVAAVVAAAAAATTISSSQRHTCQSYHFLKIYHTYRDTPLHGPKGIFCCTFGLPWFLRGALSMLSACQGDQAR
jgi:hypothetical protein